MTTKPDTSPENVARMLDGVTRAPWRVHENKRNNEETCDLSICGDIFVLADLTGPQYEHQQANARFIAYAREALPALAAERAALAADVSTYQGIVRDMTAEIGALAARVERLREALQSVLDACDQGRMVEKGAGGMTIEAQIRRSVYNGVPAWPIEEARAALEGDKP